MNSNKPFYRQIHPSFFKNGGVTSQAFKPMPKDEGLLSLYNSDHFDPETSYTHFTAQTNEFTGANLESAGVLASHIEDFASCTLTVIEDNMPFQGHASADFRNLEKKDVETKAKKLRDQAWARNWKYIRSESTNLSLVVPESPSSLSSQEISTHSISDPNQPGQ